MNRGVRASVMGAMVAGTLVATCWAASGASAHVTVAAPGATRGGSDQMITFRVPVEKDADTVGLKVLLPTDTPIASVDVAPVAGWSHTETTVKLAKPIVTDDGNITDAVSEIDWTAAPGQGLKPGEFGAFTIIAGQLPDTATLTFKAIELYSDGSEVDWTQVDAPGSTAELDDPAPVPHLAYGAYRAYRRPDGSRRDRHQSGGRSGKGRCDGENVQRRWDCAWRHCARRQPDRTRTRIAAAPSSAGRLSHRMIGVDRPIAWALTALFAVSAFCYWSRRRVFPRRRDGAAARGRGGRRQCARERRHDRLPLGLGCPPVDDRAGHSVHGCRRLVRCGAATF